MTKVTIKQSQVPKEQLVHKIGNWYKYGGDYLILCGIEDGAVLVGMDGSYFSGLVYNCLSTALTQDEFDACCGGFSSEFQLVPNITISEE